MAGIFNSVIFNNKIFNVGVVTAVVSGGSGKRKRRKHHIPSWDLVWQIPDYDRPIPPIHPETDRATQPAVIEVINAEAEAEALRRAILEERSEISRIKKQIQLSSNRSVVSSMKAEISRIEAHIVKMNQEVEDTLLMAVFM